MATISLAMIVRDEERTLERVLAGAKQFCDELIVVDTGSVDRTRTIAAAAGARVVDFVWVDDFSAARNFAFAQCTQDWIVWLDADDVLAPETIAALLRHKSSTLNVSQLDCVFCPYNYEYSAAGTPSVVLMRERLLRRSKGHQWVGRIHETIPDSGGFTTLSDIVVEHRPHPEDMPRKKGRNLRNYQAWLDPRTADLRDVFLYGGELLDNGQAHEAIQVLELYLERSNYLGTTSERYMAMVKLADALLVAKRGDEAIRRCLLAVELNPERAEAYCLLGLHFLREERWYRAWPLLVAAASCVPPASPVVVQSFYGEVPVEALSECIIQMGDPALGNQLHGVLEKIKDRIALAPKVTYDHPDPAEPIGRRPVIRIFVGDSWEPFSPDTQLQRGMGGSESAVVEMAREWSRMGCKVVVYGRTTGEWDGVLYCSHEQWSPNHPSDVCVAWRGCQALLQQRPNAKHVILWMHDGELPSRVSDLVAKRIDRVAVLSQFHGRWVAQSHPNLVSKLWYVSNGIAATRYGSESAKAANRFIYSSDPRRGLAVLLDQWPAVRAVLPDAELHVAYGFELAIEIVRFHQGERAAVDLQAMFERLRSIPGIVYHGRMGQDALAALQKTCVAWLYPPSTFNETFCITALEAQAAGCVPIARNNGALPEVIKNSITWNDPGELVRLLTVELPAFPVAALRTNRTWAMSKSWENEALHWVTELLQSRVAA